MPFGPTAYFGIVNTVLRHDIKDKAVLGKMKEVAPHLILDNFTTSLGERTANILKHLFPMPKDDSKRVITFANQKDYISFRCVRPTRRYKSRSSSNMGPFTRAEKA